MTLEKLNEFDSKKRAALEKMEKQLAEYNAERDGLEHERLTIINGDDVNAMAEILRKIKECDGRIEAVNQMIAQRNAAIGYTEDEVVEVANKIVDDSQKRIDKLIAEYMNARDSVYKTFRDLCIGIAQANYDRDRALIHHAGYKSSALNHDIRGLKHYTVKVNANEINMIINSFAGQEEKFAMMMLISGSNNDYYRANGIIKTK